MVAGEPLTIRVMHSGSSTLRLTTDMTLSFIAPYDGHTYEVSENDLKELEGTTKGSDDPPLAGVDAST